MKNIVILLSGRGSNFVSIVKEAERAGWAKEGLKIACVVSNRPGAAGLERTKEFGIDAFCVDHKTYETREAFENAVIDILDRYDPAVVVLAGFMRVLTPNFVNHFGGRILNIHPALLPLFKGLDTHQRALDAGVRLHGCTVHFVSAELDGGSIIGQAAVPVLASDTAETLAARVLRLEHILYPRAVYAVASGRVRIENGRTVTDDETAKYLAIFDKDNASAA
ncbi:phosphoribosylglycinamide formyltransferase [Duodenibacillus massiliensis]|uniref:phosphoribosylglycinamide formyltransferase n=1 Tax=Duodenibacillus massiliensis TaxID=1852381 RepID=UPI003F8189C9